MQSFFIAVALLLPAGCILALAQGSGAEGEIRGVLAAQEAAWNRADVAAFMEGYEKSPELTFSGASGVTPL